MNDEQPYSYKIINTGKDGTLHDLEPVRFPIGIQPAEMFNYLTDIFGAPLEDAVMDTEEFGRVSIGWVFRPQPGADVTVRDLTVVPLIDDPDDPATPISMFVHQERLRASLTGAMAEGGVEVETVTTRPRGRR